MEKGNENGRSGLPCGDCEEFIHRAIKSSDDRAAVAEEEARRLRRCVMRKDSQVRDEYAAVCDGCGGAVYIDTSIPSWAWNRIANDGESMLCAVCIDRRLEKQDLHIPARFFYAGEGLFSEPYADRWGWLEFGVGFVIACFLFAGVLAVIGIANS